LGYIPVVAESTSDPIKEHLYMQIVTELKRQKELVAGIREMTSGFAPTVVHLLAETEEAHLAKQQQMMKE
jgi:hypothetical protein